MNARNGFAMLNWGSSFTGVPAQLQPSTTGTAGTCTSRAIRTSDLIGKYHSDLLYFDGGIPYVDVGLSVIANYFNDNQKWNNGRLDAVLNLKKGETTKGKVLYAICLDWPESGKSIVVKSLSTGKKIIQHNQHQHPWI
ncbi:hypothetical protein ES705_15401 [subsurface metagenome]